MKMPTSKRYLNSICLLILPLSIISVAQGVQIQFFQGENFTQWIWEADSGENCTKIPNDKITDVFAIRTDTCFIAFEDEDCKSAMSARYMPGNYSVKHHELRKIRSFYMCTEKEGGNQLNIDILTTPFENMTIVVSESYKNVFSCVNVPKNIQNLAFWSINNHHNEMLAYFERDCSINKWDAKLVEPGLTYLSWNLHNLEKIENVTNTTYKVQSFGPDPNAVYYKVSCLSLPLEATTKNSEKLSEIKENKCDFDMINERFQLLTNQNVEMLKQQEKNFAMLIQLINELKQQTGNSLGIPI